MSYSSPALNGETLTWNSSCRFTTTKFDLRDSKGVLIARWHPHAFKWKKSSQIELFRTDAVRREIEAQRLMDEIVVIGMSFLQFVTIIVSIVATS